MSISESLINWYNIEARILPWRNTNDPYLIWVSEIILQQTRVEQGLPYYLRFTKTFPNIESLSHAPEDQVLKLWQGLGYYSRARNMMFAAKEISDSYNGIFPHTYDEIIKLKGIGPYTAAAIASFAFKLPYAVVDGNVFRVLSRFYGVDTPINSTKGKKYFGELAQEILNSKNPATHNQAIMEFGALHCKPANPKCKTCPLASNCVAFATKQTNELPVKGKKLRILNKYLHFFLIQHEQQILIEKRDYSSIWKGLYQLPLIETDKEELIEDVMQHPNLVKIIGKNEVQLVNVQETKHKLTHRNLHIRFYHLVVAEFQESEFLKVKIEALEAFAFPRPIELYLQDFISNC